jgi:hypothetical protein
MSPYEAHVNSVRGPMTYAQSTRPAPSQYEVMRQQYSTRTPGPPPTTQSVMASKPLHPDPNNRALSTYPNELKLADARRREVDGVVRVSPSGTFNQNTYGGANSRYMSDAQRAQSLGVVDRGLKISELPRKDALAARTTGHVDPATLTPAQQAQWLTTAQRTIQRGNVVQGVRDTYQRKTYRNDGPVFLPQNTSNVLPKSALSANSGPLVQRYYTEWKPTKPPAGSPVPSTTTHRVITEQPRVHLSAAGRPVYSAQSVYVARHMGERADQRHMKVKDTSVPLEPMVRIR